MKIIAFTGKMGSGKTTLASLLIKKLEREYLSFVPMVKFADPLYDMQKYIYDRVNLPQPKPKDRRLLQFLGTDWGRSIDKELWLNCYKDELRGWEKSDWVITDDLRFDNEAELVRSLGGIVIRVEASVTERQKRLNIENPDHVSEQGVKAELVDKTIWNDGGLIDADRTIERLASELLGRS